MELKARWAPAIYFLVGQMGWFACVLGAARGESFWGIALVIILIVLHLRHVKRPVAEVKLVVTVMLLGALWESALVDFGLLEYPHSSVVDGLAPLWLLALWALFAAQFNTTYRWLKQRVWAGALLGALAGPLSFRAGAELGAVRFVTLVPTTVSLAVGWAILLPLVIVLSRRWDGVA